jgi:thiamine pyrophosphate-dependent acetolactate synthase large subunit-like protein
MSKMKVSDMLALAFQAEGVQALFTLMGDANMYWCEAMSRLPGMQVVHARHEHCAVAMADGYARTTGKVGVASTTCGPGFTQIMTGLTIAARANVPIVVFAGDSPLTSAFYVQQIDMGPLALACGAHYIPVRSIDRVLDNVREAFHVAQLEQCPVVLSIPMDLQKQPFPFMADYLPSAAMLPTPQRPAADPALVERVVAMIEAAEKPIFIAGKGAVRSGAREAIEALSAQCGALVSTSLLSKGLFEGNPYALDIAGSFASDFARARFAESDLVIGFGAGLGAYTTESGYLYPDAQTVQVDLNPRGLWQGLRTADLHIRADARAAAEQITEALRMPPAGDDRGDRRRRAGQQAFRHRPRHRRPAQGVAGTRCAGAEGLDRGGWRRPLFRHRGDPSARPFAGPAAHRR